MEEKKYLTKEEISEECTKIYVALKNRMFGQDLPDREIAELTDAANAKIFQLLEENCYVVDIWFPVIKSNVPYKPELVHPKDCPYGKGVQCYSCKNLFSYRTRDGHYKAGEIYKGYCLKVPVEYKLKES